MSKGFQQGIHIKAEKSVTYAQIVIGKLINIIYSIDKFGFETHWNYRDRWIAMGAPKGEDCKYSRNYFLNLYVRWLVSHIATKCMISFIGYVFYTLKLSEKCPYNYL